MAKAGQVKGTTTKKKDFAGTSVEGQKGQDAKQATSTPPADPPVDETTPPADQPGAETVTAPPAETQPANGIVRGEDVIKILRKKGHQV